MRVVGDRFVDCDRARPLLIRKTIADPFHHGTLGATRSLGRIGVPVYSEAGRPWRPARATTTATTSACSRCPTASSLWCS
jgi:hypothetical protein